MRASAERQAPANATPASTSPDGAAHAASCVTPSLYAEFPGEAERFDCSSGLGALTREELARAGWRVDYVERIATPPAAGTPPLFKYKLVISR